MTLVIFVWRWEDNLEKLALSIYHAGPGTRTQVIGLGGKYFYLLAEQPTSPAHISVFNQNNGPRSSKSSAYSIHTVSFYGDNLHRPGQVIRHSLQGFLKQSVSNKAKGDGVQPISDCFLHQTTPLPSRWQQRWSSPDVYALFLVTQSFRYCPPKQLSEQWFG